MKKQAISYQNQSDEKLAANVSVAMDTSQEFCSVSEKNVILALFIPQWLQ